MGAGISGSRAAVGTALVPTACTESTFVLARLRNLQIKIERAEL